MRPPPRASSPRRHSAQRCVAISSDRAIVEAVCAVLRRVSAQVTFDLSQVPVGHHLQLRDTLLTALRGCAQGPRTVITQLCLALAGLALQAPQWENVVQNMYDMFGRDPATVTVLLEFLTVFPEELSGNSKIPVSVSGLLSAFVWGLSPGWRGTFSFFIGLTGLVLVFRMMNIGTVCRCC
jgi:Exportin 1-like protein